MKKIIFALSVITTAILFGCGGKNQNEQIPGMREVNLNAYEKQLTLFVPDSTKGTLDVKNEPSGATTISVGKDFNISINYGDGNMDLKKSDLQGDPVRKLVKLHVDKPDTLVYETQIEGMPSVFRFYVIAKVGNSSYEIEDIEIGEGYSEKAIKNMLNSVKTLKTAEKPKS